MRIYGGNNYCSRCKKEITVPVDLGKAASFDKEGKSVLVCFKCKQNIKATGEGCSVEFCGNAHLEKFVYCEAHKQQKFQLIDTNRQMVEAWEKHFGDLPNFTIKVDSAFSVPTQCVISPSNSFGFLDGGFDAAITKNLGEEVQIQLQQRINSPHYNGELLVGQAILFETGSPKIRWCIAAPTMRVPMILGNKTVNPYLAAKAIFIILKKNPGIRVATIPGLGTGVGLVPYDLCAFQMRKAYDEFYVKDSVIPPSSWHQAQKNHQLLYETDTSKIRDLQFDM